MLDQSIPYKFLVFVFVSALAVVSLAIVFPFFRTFKK